MRRPGDRRRDLGCRVVRHDRDELPLAVVDGFCVPRFRYQRKSHGQETRGQDIKCWFHVRSGLEFRPKTATIILNYVGEVIASYFGNYPPNLDLRITPFPYLMKEGSAIAPSTARRPSLPPRLAL